MRLARIPAAIIALTMVLGATGAFAANKSAPARRDCFLSNDWEGWSAPGDGDTLLLNVRFHEVYRVDLTPGSHAHKTPGYFLINRVRGSNWICSPLDLDLSISDQQGFRTSLIARGLHKLTPEEVAAIPPKDRP
jgi:hypothetical protein